MDLIKISALCLALILFGFSKVHSSEVLPSAEKSESVQKKAFLLGDKIINNTLNRSVKNSGLSFCQSLFVNSASITNKEFSTSEPSLVLTISDEELNLKFKSLARLYLNINQLSFNIDSSKSKLSALNSMLVSPEFDSSRCIKLYSVSYNLLI